MTDDFDAKLAEAENAVARSQAKRMAELEREIEQWRNGQVSLRVAIGTLAAERDALRGEVERLRTEMGHLRQHVAHNDEEYKVMKDVLRAEHKACCEMRPIVEAAKVWRTHEQNHGAAVGICRACHAKDVGFCDQHNMSYEVLLVLEGELEAAIDAAHGGGEGKP